jgi:hypothetical protein
MRLYAAKWRGKLAAATTLVIDATMGFAAHRPALQLATLTIHAAGAPICRGDLAKGFFILESEILNLKSPGLGAPAAA